MNRWAIGFGAFTLISLVGCATLGDFASDNPGFDEVPGAFEGRFIAISDADMAATAYADGKLEPFDGALDEVTLFADGQPVSKVAAPNSVVSWPQVAAVSPDGHRAYIIETRGSPPAGTVRVDSAYTSLPEGRALRVFDIMDNSISEVAFVENVGLNPQSIDISDDGRFLAIASESEGAELTIIALDEDGLPEEVRLISLDPPYAAEDQEKRIRTLHLSPDGQKLAVNVGNVRYQFYAFDFDDIGVPTTVAPIGDPIEFGVRLAVGRWSPNDRYFIVTDVNAYDSSLQMLIQRGGRVHVVKVPTGNAPAELVASNRVGRFAEGLEISDNGELIASIAMERTYLPELSFLETWPRRRTYLLTLFSFDQETGELAELDRIRTAGVLPEDVIFDEQGRNLAVAVFHRRKGADRRRGFIDFFEIT
ncbi:MAG: hypothetical protein AAFY34_16040, partial [Pseudomonadota bacterium]